MVDRYDEPSTSLVWLPSAEPENRDAIKAPRSKKRGNGLDRQLKSGREDRAAHSFSPSDMISPWLCAPPPA
jgi:hypothetical protein